MIIVHWRKCRSVGNTLNVAVPIWLTSYFILSCDFQRHLSGEKMHGKDRLEYISRLSRSNLNESTINMFLSTAIQMVLQLRSMCKDTIGAVR